MEGARVTKTFRGQRTDDLEYDMEKRQSNMRFLEISPENIEP